MPARPRHRGRFRRQAGRAAPSTDIVEAEIIEHVDLNSSRSDKETIHLALAFDGGAPAYEPGDSLDLYPENDPAYVDELLKPQALQATRTLRSDFIKSRDVTTLSLKTVETYAAQTGHQYVKALIADGRGARLDRRPPAHRPDRAPFRSRSTAEQLRALTRPLAPRAYSIASSRREVGDEAHLLISAVRYESHGRARKGVASNYRRRAAQARRPRAREAQAQQAFRAAGARPGHHHGRPRHRRRAVPRLRAGAPRHGGERPQLAVLRRPPRSPTTSSTSSTGRTRSRTAR